jgi:hypothetical protein
MVSPLAKLFSRGVVYKETWLVRNSRWVFKHTNNTISIEANYGPGPASELQQLFFGVFEHFTLGKDAGVADEFNRLVREKGWNYKQAKYQRKWCFGKSKGQKTYGIINDKSYSDNSSHRETGTQSETNIEWDFVSNAGRHSDLLDYSIISAEGGVVLNQMPDSAITLSNEFEQLAVRHANAVKHRSNVSVSTSNRYKHPAMRQNEAGETKKQRRAQALEVDFRTFFGSDHGGLKGWQKLCEIVELPSDLRSVTQYKKVRYLMPVSVEIVLKVVLITISRPWRPFISIS